jgi:hypothetical protein
MPALPIVLFLVTICFPLLVAGLGIVGVRNDQKYADPAAATLPVTFRSSRLRVLMWFVPATGGLILALMLLALGVQDGAWQGGMTATAMGLALLLPSARYFGWSGYRLVQPDTLMLCDQGIVYRSFGKRERWPWREVIDADCDLIIYKPSFRNPGGTSFSKLHLVLEGGYRQMLGNFWWAPFGLQNANYMSKILRATIAAHKAQPIIAS